MKETPFNPILIPGINRPRGKAGPRTNLRRISRNGVTRRVLDAKASTIRFARKVRRKTKASWKRIKGGIQARLANLDREQLRKVLLACGIAAAAVAAILILVKLMPVIIAILAVLGLGVAIQTWDRLRPMRPA